MDVGPFSAAIARTPRALRAVSSVATETQFKKRDLSLFGGPQEGDAKAVDRKLVTVAGTLLTLGGLTVVLAGKWGQLAHAAVGASPWLLGAAMALHIGSLVARSEAWHISVRAAGGTVARRRLYRAASVGYIGNLLNGEVGFALRVASLRRAAPACCRPTAQMPSPKPRYTPLAIDCGTPRRNGR